MADNANQTGGSNSPQQYVNTSVEQSSDNLADMMDEDPELRQLLTVATQKPQQESEGEYGPPDTTQYGPTRDTPHGDVKVKPFNELATMGATTPEGEKPESQNSFYGYVKAGARGVVELGQETLKFATGLGAGASYHTGFYKVDRDEQEQKEFREWYENTPLDQMGLITAFGSNIPLYASDAQMEQWKGQRTQSQKVVENVTQFVVGMANAGRWAKGAEALPVVGGALKAANGFKVGKVAITGMLSGALTDLTFFDPHEERLSNLVRNLPPDKYKAVMAYLTPTAAEKDDSEVTARMKNAFEGMMMGAAMDTLFHGLRVLRTKALLKLGKATEEDVAKEIVATVESSEKSAGGHAADDELVKVVPEPDGKTAIVPAKDPAELGKGLGPRPQLKQPVPEHQLAGLGGNEGKINTKPEGFTNMPEAPGPKVEPTPTPNSAPKGTTPVLEAPPKLTEEGKKSWPSSAKGDKGPDGFSQAKTPDPNLPPKEPTNGAGGAPAGDLAELQKLRESDGPKYGRKEDIELAPEEQAALDAKFAAENPSRPPVEAPAEPVELPKPEAPAEVPAPAPEAPAAPQAAQAGEGTNPGKASAKVKKLVFTDPAEAQNVAGAMNMAHRNELLPAGKLTPESENAVKVLLEKYKNITDPKEAAEALEQLGFQVKYAQQPADVLNVVRAVAESMPEGAAKGGSKTWKEMAKEAAGVLDGMSGEDLLNAAKNMGIDTGKMDAFITSLRTTLWAHASKVKKLSELADANPNNAIAADQLRQGLQTLWDLQNHLHEINSNVARALASNQMPVGEMVVKQGGEMVSEAVTHEADAVLESTGKTLEEAAAKPTAEAVANAEKSLDLMEKFLNKLGDFRNPSKAEVAKPGGAFTPDGHAIDTGPSPKEMWAKAVKDGRDMVAKVKESIQDKLGDFRNPAPAEVRPPKGYSVQDGQPLSDLGPSFKQVWNDHMKKLKDTLRAEWNQQNKVRQAMGLPKEARPEGLGPHRAPVSSNKAGGVFDELTPKQIRALARSVFLTDGDPGKALMLIRGAKLEVQAKKAADPTMARKLWEGAMNLRMQAMLSGPKTQLTNAIGNTMVALQRPVEYWWAGVRSGNKELQQQGADILTGLFENMRESWTAAGLAFKNGENVLDGAAQVVDNARGLGTWKPQEGLSTVGVAKHWLNRLANLPGRMLLASDELAKQLNYRANVKSEIFRRLRERGITDPKELAEQAAEMMEFQFDPKGSATNMTGLQYARISTFTNELGADTMGNTIQNMVNKHPALRLVLPFVKTPTNIFRYTWERTPVLNLFNKSFMEDLAAGGERAAVAHAKNEMGAAIYSTAALLAYNQKITGKGPSDPKLRADWKAAGFQPYSVRIGDRWVSYQKADPVLTAVGIVADIATISGEMRQKDWDQLPAAAISAIVSNLSNKTFMQGASEFMDAISNDREGGKYLEKFLVSTTTSFIPNVARQMNTDDTVREARGFVDEVMSRVPGFSDNLEPRTNIFGEHILRPPGMFMNLNNSINPFTVSRPMDDEGVMNELLQLGRSLPMPAEKIGQDDAVDLKDVKLGTDGHSPYYRMMQLMANPGEGQKSLREAMTELVNSAEWKSASGEGAFKPGGKKYRMAAPIIAGYQAAALQQVIAENPKLQEAMRQSYELEAEAIQGGPDAVKSQSERYEQLFVKPRKP